MNFSCLKFGFVDILSLIIFFTFGSIWLEKLNIIYFLLPLQSCLLLIIKHLEVILECFGNFFTHKLILFCWKRNIFLFFMRIIKSRWCFNRITMRYAFKNDSPCSCLLEFGNTEETWVVPKYLSVISKQFWKDSCLIIPRLPDLILGPVKKNILFYRMSMKVKKHDQSGFPFLLQFYHQLF